jgi:LysR family transcriptional regulator, benzoate and cis,cis-muconate-responsive activator of ben and cat genes
MALELNDLRLFLVLSEQLHFRRAAGILHISQIALSKQISRLKNQLGGQLLHRRSHGLHLSSASRVLIAT